MSTDELLRRVERRALLLALLGCTIAFVVPGGGWREAAGVAGGALLSGVSYWSIRRSVVGLADRLLTPGARHATNLGGIAVIVLRYALLALLAYVMIARLRLAPLGLLGGASVIPVAVALELGRRRA